MAAFTSVSKEVLQTMAAADLILNLGDLEGTPGSGSSATPSGVHPILVGVGAQFHTTEGHSTPPENNKRPSVDRALVSKL